MIEKIVEGSTEKPKEELKIAEVLPADYQKEIVELNAKIDKLTNERDSYRSGVKKWQDIARQRGLDPDNFPEEDKIAIIVEQKVQEQLKSSQIVEEILKRDALIKKITLDLSEATLALKNRPPAPTNESNQDKPEVKVDFFTPEQLEDLKKRGVDPQKVIENMRKQSS